MPFGRCTGAENVVINNGPPKGNSALVITAQSSVDGGATWSDATSVTIPNNGPPEDQDTLFITKGDATEAGRMDRLLLAAMDVGGVCDVAIDAVSTTAKVLLVALLDTPDPKPVNKTRITIDTGTVWRVEEA
jgi:hypothetical protein